MKYRPYAFNNLLGYPLENLFIDIFISGNPLVKINGSFGIQNVDTN